MLGRRQRKKDNKSGTWGDEMRRGRGGDRNENRNTQTSTQKFSICSLFFKRNHVENFLTPIIIKPNANFKWFCRHNDNSAWKINHKRMIGCKHRSEKDEFYMKASLPTFLAWQWESPVLDNLTSVYTPPWGKQTPALLSL